MLLGYVLAMTWHKKATFAEDHLFFVYFCEAVVRLVQTNPYGP